jgi:hypothetical protein
MWLSICKPRNSESFVMNFTVLVLSKFRTKLSAANSLVISERTKFDSEQISSKFLLAIMTLIQSANNIRSDAELILRGVPFICIMNNRDPRIDPWGTPCFSMLQSQKKC